MEGLNHSGKARGPCRTVAYRKGRSTEDAINAAMRVVAETESKYVTGIFVDISDAFDNLWWPALFERLRQINYPLAL